LRKRQYDNVGGVIRWEHDDYTDGFVYTTVAAAQTLQCTMPGQGDQFRSTFTQEFVIGNRVTPCSRNSSSGVNGCTFWENSYGFGMAFLADGGFTHHTQQTILK